MRLVSLLLGLSLAGPLTASEKWLSGDCFAVQKTTEHPHKTVSPQRELLQLLQTALPARRSPAYIPARPITMQPSSKPMAVIPVWLLVAKQIMSI